MTLLSFLGGPTVEVDLPAGWTARRITSLAGPAPRMNRGARSTRVRASLTVERSGRGESSHPDPVGDGITWLEPPRNVDGALPHRHAVLRFIEPWSGAIVQQRRQTLEIEGERFTVILSCEPMHYPTLSARVRARRAAVHPCPAGASSLRSPR